MVPALDDMSMAAMATPKLILECTVCKVVLGMEFVTIKGAHYHPQCVLPYALQQRLSAKT